MQGNGEALKVHGACWEAGNHHVVAHVDADAPATNQIPDNWLNDSAGPIHIL